jgi:AraC-like DNA-binding protein
VLQTSDLDHFEHVLLNTYGAKSLEVPDPSGLLVQGNFVQLQDIALGFGATTKRAIVSFDETEYARLQFPMRGTAKNEVGGQAAVMSAGQPCVTSPYRATIMDYGGHFEEIVLRLRADSLNRELARMTGVGINRKIEFERQQFTNQQSISGLENLMQSFIRSIDDETALISPVAVRELEQAIVVQFLFACRHNYSPLLERDASNLAPLQVRLTAEYIDAHWNQPITIDALVEASGASARALFKNFAKAYGCSPMQYVKNVRLEKARKRLSDAGTKQSVTAVAFACGFLNLGHFARDYRNRFGELPSQTLSRNLFRK